MNEERKPLGPDTFEMPNTPNTNNGPMIDSAMPTIDNLNTSTPVAPVIDNAMPSTNPIFEAPVIDDAVPPMSAPVINTQAIDNMSPVMENYNTPTIDTPVVPTTDNYAAPVIDSNTQMADNYMNQVTDNNSTVDSFNYNFDFESQINNNINYGNTVPPVTPVAPVNIEPEPVAPVSPVPIIMPEDNTNTNITSGDSSNEGIVSGPGNQMTNTFNSYINDNETTNNALKTANIVKETKTTKDSKSGLIFLFVIFLIIAIFIILLPKLI